jgi:hypothetical protein
MPSSMIPNQMKNVLHQKLQEKNKNIIALNKLPDEKSSSSVSSSSLSSNSNNNENSEIDELQRLANKARRE